MRERKEEGGVLQRVIGHVVGRLERGPEDAEELGGRPPRRRQQEEADSEGGGASVAGGVEGGGPGVVEEASRHGVVGVQRLLLVVGIAQPRVRQPGGAQERGEGVEGPVVDVCMFVYMCVKLIYW